MAANSGKLASFYLGIAIAVFGARSDASAQALKVDPKLFFEEPVANIFAFSAGGKTATPILKVPKETIAPKGTYSLSMAAKAAVKLKEMSGQMTLLEKDPKKCSESGRQYLDQFLSDLNHLSDPSENSKGELGIAHREMVNYGRESGRDTHQYLAVWKAVYSLHSEVDALRQRAVGLKLNCEL